jgi:hypothetical protein
MKQEVHQPDYVVSVQQFRCLKCRRVDNFCFRGIRFAAIQCKQCASFMKEVTGREFRTSWEVERREALKKRA